MNYAIVAEYADGEKTVNIITQNAVLADRDNFCLDCFVYDDTLHIGYVTRVNPNNKIHPIEMAYMGISLDNCLSVTVYNVDGLTPVSPWRDLYYGA